MVEMSRYSSANLGTTLEYQDVQNDKISFPHILQKDIHNIILPEEEDLLSKSGLQQEQCAGDFLMLPQNSYLQHKHCAITERASYLTQSELDGSSSIFSLHTTKHSSSSDHRNHNIVSSVEKCQTKKEKVSSSIEDSIKNVDDEMTEETCVTIVFEELGDVPVSHVPYDSAKNLKSWRSPKISLPGKCIKKLELQKQFKKEMSQYLYIDNGPRQEHPHMKREEMGDKDNSSKWMLNIELEQDLDGIQPALRRKVHSLVEAFQDPTDEDVSQSVLPLVNQDSDENKRNRISQWMCQKNTLVWTLAVTNVIIEALSTAFDQLSSPNKPEYALIGLLMSVTAVFFCIIEFVYEAREARVISRRLGSVWLLSCPSATFIHTFGLACAVFQCIFSVIQYAYFSHHAESPLKISVLPLIFALCVAYSRFHNSNRELTSPKENSQV